MPVLALAACFPPATAPPAPRSATAPAVLQHVRTASGRPPVVLVAREGDPAAALAAAVTTAGVGFNDAGDDPEPATALAGVLEARLRARSFDVQVTPAWDGLRVSALFVDASDTARFVDALREAFGAPAKNADLAAAKKKLAALGQRPLRDRALARWARCVGTPHVAPERAGKDYADVDLARLERWRTASFGLGRVAFAVTAPAAAAERVAKHVLEGPAWTAGAALGAATESADPGVDVFESPELATVPVLHATLDVGTSSAAVTTADALGDPRGPLASRLSELDLPFRLREVTGTAHARGGCVGVVLEAAPSAQTASPAGADLAARVADALALVHVEANVFRADPTATNATDARRASPLQRSGDARDAAERAAWWALADQAPARAGGSSVALALPSRRGAKEAPLEPSRETLAAAVAHAEAAWQKPIIEARTRVEAGQSEAWVLVGSPCGADDEIDGDSGLTALFVSAAADTVRTSGDVRLEPWVANDGAGILVHGPALPGETPAAHARRIADVAARSFAAEPIPSWTLTRARADLLRHDARSDGAAMSALANALAPLHPSWIQPWGASEPIARSADGTVLLRAQALRAGPIRLAVMANTDASQADAAIRAADRWVPRHGTAPRTCPAPTTAQAPKPGTYAVAARPGTIPEAYLAFPFSPGDEAAHDAASLVAAALEGEGWLDKALVSGAATPFAREASARVVGWPHAPALVIRIVADEAKLDLAVMQARALLDSVRVASLKAEHIERATNALARARLAALLDPRARVLATWRGEPVSPAPARRPTAEDVLRFVQRHLVEDSMVVVAVRPPRPSHTP